MGANSGAASYVSYLSQDGGATWRALPQAGPHSAMSLTSFGGEVYAAGFGLSASGAELRDVWVSRDGGRSWRALGASSLAPNPNIWANPQTGELLGTNNYDLVPTLWRSENGGASWSRISVPDVVGEGGQQTFIVASNGSGWRICAAGTAASGPNAKNTLACSADLGNTWTHPPALNPSQYSPKGFTFTAPSDVFAIADDGALLAFYDDITSGIQLEALAPGASAWTPLNAPSSAPGTPQAVASGSVASSVYTTGPGDGMLWINSGAAATPFATAVYS